MLRDILDDAIALASVPISDGNFIRDYNHIVHDLAMMYDTAKNHTPSTVVCSDTNTEYNLPTGCLKIDMVLNSKGEYFSCYDVRNNSTILFALIDTYTIHGTFDQAPAKTMSDDVTINPLYTKAVTEYIAAKAVKKSNPDYSKELMADSASDAQLANMNIRKATNPNKRVYAPPFR